MKQQVEPAYDRPAWPVLAIFSLYVVTWFLQLGSRISVLGAIRFEFLLAITLLVLTPFIPRQPTKTTDLYAYLALFLLALVTQIPFSYNVDYSWTIFVDRVVKFACLALFIIVFVRSPNAMRLLMASIVFAWLKMGQEEWIGRVTGSLVWENQGVMRLNGVTGLYSHPTSLSGLGLGMIPFIYYLFPVVNKWGKVVLLVLLVLSLNIILFTGARTGYVGFLFFLAYIFWRAKHKMRFVVSAAAMCLIALPYIPEQYVARFESITGQEAEGSSKLKRIEILKDAAVIFQEHPFGVGVSAFPTIREQRFGRSQDTHNLYMEILTNLGIQGFIIWVIYIAALFRAITRLRGEFGRQLAVLHPLLTRQSKDARARHRTRWSAINNVAGLKGALSWQLTELRSLMKRSAKDVRSGHKAALSAPRPVAERHYKDLTFLMAMLNAVNAYLIIRLVVGFFGMDLYEIYWWLVLGIVVSLHNINQVSSRITDRLLGRPSIDAARGSSPSRARRPLRGARGFAE